MKRPSYAVVSYALVGIAVFGLIVESLRSSIPPNDLNRLRYEQAEFMIQGSRSEVDWRVLEPSAFAEARRTGRPILLLIGAPWSKEARAADRDVFADREVVSFLNRYLVCIRIDCQSEPRWMGAFLPLRRSSLPICNGFQVWFLTPEGQLIDNAGEFGTVQPVFPELFASTLERVKDRIAAIRANTMGDYTPGSEQAADVALLTAASFPEGLSDQKLLQALRQSAAVGLGGPVRFGQVRLNPNGLRYLLLSSREREAREMLFSLLKGPLPDWLDGGFFESFDPATQRIGFDKVAVTNAEMMAVLAKAGESMKEPLFRKYAELTFDYLARRIVQNGFVAGAEIGDEGIQERSKRKSFSPVRMRALLSAEERVIARDQLGLTSERNSMMTIRFSNPANAFDDAGPAVPVLKKLRSGSNDESQFAGKRQLDVHGFVVARMIECARMWNEPHRLQEVDNLYSRIDWFLAGDDVKHSLEHGISDKPCLADYLAFADAALQHYLTFGRIDSLQNGFQVLRRARFLFESEVPGVWRIANSQSEGLGPQNVDVPEVLDFVRESCTAQAIRLCRDYGNLLRTEAGRSLLQAAQTTAGQCSAMATNLGVEGASLFCATAYARDDLKILVSGPDAVARARQLAATHSNRFVAPVLGSIQNDLQVKIPGIYLDKSGLKLAGPMGEETLAEELQKNSKK